MEDLFALVQIECCWLRNRISLSVTSMVFCVYFWKCLISDSSFFVSLFFIPLSVQTCPWWPGNCEKKIPIVLQQNGVFKKWNQELVFCQLKWFFQSWFMLKILDHMVVVSMACLLLAWETQLTLLLLLLLLFWMNEKVSVYLYGTVWHLGIKIWENYQCFI